MALNLISKQLFSRQRYAELYTQLRNANLHSDVLFTPLHFIEALQVDTKSTLNNSSIASETQQTYLEEQLKQLRPILKSRFYEVKKVTDIVFDANEFYGYRFINPNVMSFKDERLALVHGAMLFLTLTDGQSLVIVFQQIDLKNRLYLYKQPQKCLKPAYYFINRVNVTSLIYDGELSEALETDCYLRLAELVNLNQDAMTQHQPKTTNTLTGAIDDYQRFLMKRWRMNNDESYSEDRTPLYKFLTASVNLPSIYQQVIRKLTHSDRVEQINIEIERLKQKQREEDLLCQIDIQAYVHRARLERAYIDKTHFQFSQENEQHQARYQQRLQDCKSFIQGLNDSDKKRCESLILFDDGRTQTPYSETERQRHGEQFKQTIQDKINQLQEERWAIIQQSKTPN